jgi:hypothetical protein
VGLREIASPFRITPSPSLKERGNKRGWVDPMEAERLRIEIPESKLGAIK